MSLLEVTELAEGLFLNARIDLNSRQVVGRPYT